ncbi:uncharacterized protein RHO25_010744 [Cercospora beticola]|uniref:Secreted protein n=1 Tax=Cercospora beticola TaxID=122368 RepID=A0ABZ0P2M5_CERBT|nr:hypothetical protein RHO25_010744 [Cercospora beticola]
MRVAFLLCATLAAFTRADDPPETTEADLGEEINLDDVASLAEDSDGQTYAKDCGTLEALKANCPTKYG